MTDYTRDDVTIRPAVSEDREALEAIAAQTWDGSDYLPQVFNTWLEDEHGGFDVIVLHNKVIGAGKLSKFSENEWWLEGLRIHPSYQGQGFARIMHHYKVAQARQIGHGILRFSTSSTNHAVNKLATETGFQVVTELAIFSTPAEAVETSKRFWQLGEDDFERIEMWLNHSQYFERAAHSYESAWKLRLLTEETIHQFLDDGRVYGWNRHQAQSPLEGILFVQPVEQNLQGETVLRVSFGDTVADQRYDFWEAVKGLAFGLGAEKVHAKIVDDEPFITPFVSQEWNRADINVLLFSRPLDLTVESNIEFETLPALE